MSRFELITPGKPGETEETPSGSPAWKQALKTAGVIGGSMALMPGAGIAGVLELLPRVSTDPEKPLIESGSLQKAGDVIREVMETPGKLLIKTPEEAETVEKVGGVLSWPFEKSAEGLALIGEHGLQPLAKKIIGQEIPYLDPVLRTTGEAALAFGAGGKAIKGLKKVARGAGARSLEATRMAAEAKHGRFATVPERIAADVSPEGKPLLPPETRYLQEKMKERISAGQEIAPETIEPAGPQPALEGTTLYSGIPLHKAGDIWSKTVGTAVWDKAIMQGIPKVLEKIPGGKSVNRALLYKYRGDLPKTETYIKGMDEAKRFQSIGRAYAIDLGKRLQDFPEDAQLRMGEFIRGEKQNLVGKELEVATEAKQVLYDLGKQAVDTGLLSEEVFFKNAGRYMPRLYESKEYQGLLTKYGIAKPNRLDLTRFKKRQDIPKDIRKDMGEILTPGYPVAKGITQLTHDIELARWFNGIAENPEWSILKGVEGPIPGGFKQLGENKKLGNLSEAYVHPEIYTDLNEAVRIYTTPEKVRRKSLGAWKFGKVILSPKTHVRNMVSNSVLAHLGGLPMYEQPIYLTKAAKAMRAKGDYWRAAKEEGLLTSTFTNAELRELFDRVEGQMTGIKAGSIPDRIGVIGDVWDKAKIAGNKAAKLYEAEEQWFKMAKYIHNVERKNMTPMAAAADAEKWLFNYSKVTKFQESYRSKWYGAPFATFTFKALPRIAEAAIKTPWRFVLPGAIIYQLERSAMDMFKDDPEQFKAKKHMRPEWMKGTFLGIPNFARVPITDDSGREYYLNLEYVFPWGDIAESGGKFGIPGALMPMSQPFVKEAWEQTSNYDLFWNEPIVKEEDLVGKTKVDQLKTELKQRAGHAFKTFAPTPAIDIQKGIAAIQDKPDYRGRERPVETVAADVLTGFKMYPVDYADEMVKRVRKLDPKRGYLAVKIRSDIKKLAAKKKAIEKVGKNADHETELINEKLDQLISMGKELTEETGIFKKITENQTPQSEIKSREHEFVIVPENKTTPQDTQLDIKHNEQPLAETKKEMDPQTLSGFKIESQVRIADTGKIVHVTEDAHEAYQRATTKKDILSEFLDCIG